MMVLDSIKSQKFTYDESPDHLRKCPMCGQFMKFISKSKPRNILTLKGKMCISLQKYRCLNDQCPFHGNMYDPYSIALPYIKIGKDLFVELLVLKFDKKYTAPTIKKEFSVRYGINLSETTIKRHIAKAETLFLSNTRALISRMLGTIKPIIIHMDYIEPKAKRHKIFVAFEHTTYFPILYKILDVTNEANIRELIKEQSPLIQDIEKIFVSDADTSLLYTDLKDKADAKHHMCLMHFINICYKIAKPLDDAAFSVLDTALSFLWQPLKHEKDEINKNCTQFEVQDLHDSLGFLVMEIMNAISELRDKKGETYKSQRANPFVQQLISRMDRLESKKANLDLQHITEAIKNVKSYLSQNTEYFVALEQFSRDMKEICSIIKDKSLNSEQTEERLLKFAKTLKPPSISFNRIESRPKKGRKKKNTATVQGIWDHLKERVEKYAPYLSTLKDYDCEDLTNNVNESRFSALRCYLRMLMGFKDHSSHEYLNAIYYFHFTADIPCKLNLQQLSCYHIERFRKYFEFYKEGCLYYNRFHNKPRFINMKLKELEAFTMS